MRLLKLAFISAIVLFIVVTLISLLLPSEVRISRAIDIQAGSEKIYPLLANTEQWLPWNEYVKSWHNVIAETDMIMADEITVKVTSKKNNLILSNWLQPSGKKLESGYAIVGENNGNKHLTVQWYFNFHLRWYPWEKFQSIVFDQQLGPLMEKSLANLKAIAEKQ